VSAATVGRWPAEDAIKPWQYQSWIFIRDPNFAATAAAVLDLYARLWQGQPLGPDEFVISADERTSIQTRCRCHPSLPPGTSQMMRISHDYHRRGVLAYLAAYDHRETTDGLRVPLQPSSPAVPMEVHHRRSGRPTPTTRPPRTNRIARRVTPDEITNLATQIHCGVVRIATARRRSRSKSP
jgi:hypothetical protein